MRNYSKKKMALGKKTGGKDFQKGKPGGPGRPSMDADVKSIRDAMRKDIYFWCDKLFNLSSEELSTALKDKSYPSLAKGIIKSILKFRATGNWKFVEYPIDQIIGKAKQTIDAGVNIPGKVTIEVHSKNIDNEDENTESQQA